jgi:hypothetical protein
MNELWIKYMVKAICKGDIGQEKCSVQNKMVALRTFYKYGVS